MPVPAPSAAASCTCYHPCTASPDAASDDTTTMDHPYAELIDLVVGERGVGHGTCSLRIARKHLNPHGVAHGAVLYALADTGMGIALYPTLAAGELCATIEIKISYFKPVAQGTVVCRSQLVNRGKAVAHLESTLHVDDVLVAKASGHFAIFTPRRGAAAPAGPAGSAGSAEPEDPAQPAQPALPDDPAAR